jgi:hypothetical protein
MERVSVTPDHIARGDRSQTFKDPVSLALTEHLGADYAYAGWGYASSVRSEMRTNWTLGPSAAIREFLQAWDSGKPVSPFTFNASQDGPPVRVPRPGPVAKPRRYKTAAQVEGQQALQLRESGEQIALPARPATSSSPAGVTGTDATDAETALTS